MIHNSFPRLLVKIPTTQLNSNLEIVSELAFWSNMLFNPDTGKKVIQLFFFHKCDRQDYPPFIFNK